MGPPVDVSLAGRCFDVKLGQRSEIKMIRVKGEGGGSIPRPVQREKTLQIGGDCLGMGHRKRRAGKSIKEGAHLQGRSVGSNNYHRGRDTPGQN